MNMGYSEEEIVRIVMDNFACGEIEAKFIIDIELGKDVGCLVAHDDPASSEDDSQRS